MSFPRGSPAGPAPRRPLDSTPRDSWSMKEKRHKPSKGLGLRKSVGAGGLYLPGFSRRGF
eukprot:5883864-Amphidinium_carterae.1